MKSAILARGLVHRRRVAHAVEGEAPQCVPQVAPGVEVPVLAVVHEALGREGAFEGLVPRPAVVDDADPAAREQRLADGAELGGADLAARRVQDPNAPDHFRGSAPAAPEELARAVDQRLDVRPEQARVHLLEQLAEREEGPDLGLVEPEPGEGIAGGGRRRRRQPVAASPPVPLDRRVQPVAEILEVAPEGGARDLELLQKGLDRDDPPLAQQSVDAVEAFGPVHPSAPPRPGPSVAWPRRLAPERDMLTALPRRRRSRNWRIWRTWSRVRTRSAGLKHHDHLLMMPRSGPLQAQVSLEKAERRQPVRAFIDSTARTPLPFRGPVADGRSRTHVQEEGPHGDRERTPPPGGAPATPRWVPATRCVPAGRTSAARRDGSRGHGLGRDPEAVRRTLRVDGGADARARRLDRAAVRNGPRGARRGLARHLAFADRGDRTYGLHAPHPRAQAARAPGRSHPRAGLRAPPGPRHRGLVDRAHGANLLGNRLVVRPGGVPERDGASPRPRPGHRLRPPQPQRAHLPDRGTPVLPLGLVRHRGAPLPPAGEAGAG